MHNISLIKWLKAKHKVIRKILDIKTLKKASFKKMY